MTHNRCLTLACFAISALAANASTDNPARELVNKYCVSCHNAKLKTAGLALDRIDAENPYNSQETWEKVIVKLRSRSMPPPKLPRPDNATYDTVSTYLESEIDRAAG